ncbi:MAG: hypothetical protein ACJ763_05225 [Bdellovibrionia bacterium]
MNSEWLGWLSSFILCLTIEKQLHTQYKQGTSQGVSKWLYLGQFIAEIGFIIYSLIVRNWVFVFTNTVLLIENVAGVLLIRYHRKRAAKRLPLTPSL